MHRVSVEPAFSSRSREEWIETVRGRRCVTVANLSPLVRERSGLKPGKIRLSLRLYELSPLVRERSGLKRYPCDMGNRSVPLSPLVRERSGLKRIRRESHLE